MITKIYKLFPGVKEGLFALALSVFSGTAYSQSTYTFMYTGGVQTLNIQAGTYEIETWGADGGWGGTTTALTGTGGIGGYSKGVYTATSPTTLYIYVGGVGQSTNTTGSSVISAAGGWNGGGGGRNGSSNSYYRGGGGGGTDVRTTQNTTYANRIIVAGGGGGAGGSSGTPQTWVGSGGNGGGTTGQDGVLGGSQTNHNGKGGTQSGGGAGGVYSSNTGVAGSFGIGGDGGGTSNAFPAGGGGGGWYGGGGGATQGGGGGGGSGYIGGVTSGTTMQFGQTGFVTKPVTTGNGLAIIKELCNISLLVNGVSGNTTICSGNTLSLTTNAVSNYSWSTGANTSSIVVTPTTTTVYTLSAMSASNCVSSAQVTITVNSGVPSLTVANTASATSGICPSNSVMLTASGANTYSWTGATPVTNGVTFYPTTSSGYTVTGVNACGQSTAATSVSIHALPTTGTVISQPTVCSGQTVALTGVGNATLYTWAPFVPNGGAFFPPVTSSYTVTGYSAQGCTSSAVAFVTVVATPIAQPLASPPLICIGKSSTITALGATNYTIISPTGTVNTSTLVVTPNATTTYTVIKSNSNCFNTQQVTVIVNLLPPVNGIATPSIVCASKSVALQAIGGTSFTWTAANYTSTSATPTVYPANSTVYSLTASDGTCTAFTTVSVLTNPNPTITVAPTSSAICFGDTVSIVAGGGLTYTWSTPTGSVVNDTLTQSPISTTLYVVTGVNQHNCYSSNSQPVIVNPNPTLNIQSTKPLVCPGGVSTLTVSGANTYSWDANAGNATTNVVSVTPMTTTIYTATGYFVPTMCSTEKTFTVNVFQPTFAVNSPTSSCKGGTINLIASGAVTYTWNGNLPFSQIAVSPPTETVYIVSATSGSNGVNCVSTQSVFVTIYANPTITAVPQRSVICNGEFVNLIGGGGSTYNWTSGQLTMTGSVVAVNPKANIIYYVTGTDQNGCIGTATVQVKVSPCIGIDEVSGKATQISVFPNPNDGQFTVRSTGVLTLTLSNELGQLIEVIQLSSDNNYETGIRNLAAGIYFVKGSGVSEKIVVTR